MKTRWLAALLGLGLLGFAVEAQPVTSLELGAAETSSGVRKSKRTAHDRAARQQVFALRTGTVTVEGRWMNSFSLPLKTGDVLTPEKLSAAMEFLEAAITRETVQGFGLRSLGEVGVLYIDVDFSTNAPAADRVVDVTFRPYYVRFSLVKLGDNVLPIPRSAFPTLYENVPAPLLALKPTVGIAYDRAFGTSLGGAMETDLLNVAKPDRIADAPETDRHLDLNIQGSRSLEESFYRAAANLRGHLRYDGSTLREVNVQGGFDSAAEPLGGGEHRGQAGFGSAGLSLRLAPNTRLSLDAGYRRRTDGLENFSAPGWSWNSADEQINRIVLDAIPRPMEGFLRAALWEDNGWRSGGGTYQRLVARVGYGKEIALSPNQTIGLEIIGGGGHAFGGTPAQNLFFGGNSPGQFLYDSPSSPALREIPDGPLLRSFGERQAGLRSTSGVRGGDTFWHFNLNVTLPIRAWSRALIPNELTDLEDADGHPVTLKQLLRRQVDVTGPSMLAATLRQEGLTEAEANRRAEEILDEIRPATHYIIDDANLFSVKPMVMFDAAGISGRGGAAETWLAAGGGLQLTLVTAKFEIGYMQTLNGPTFGRRGNLFLRLVFQNLF